LHFNVTFIISTSITIVKQIIICHSPAMMAEHQPAPTVPSMSPQPDMTRNRLPTLFEVLSRRTLPPVDLFSFYIYMRDQQRSVDYLDFW
jgi:hypothetical protein